MVKDIRGQVLVWFGIVGGALTIVNHWSNLMTLSDWMRWVVEHFSQIIYEAWRWMGSLINIQIPRELANALSVVAFYSSLAIGSIILAGTIRHEKIKSNLIILILTVILLYCLGEMFSYGSEVYGIIILTLLFTAGLLMAGGSVLQRVVVSIELVVIYYSSAYAIAAFSDLLSNSVLLSSSQQSQWLVGMIRIMMICSLLFLPLLLAPTSALLKRLTFMLIGVAIIFGLSEVSKFVEGLKTAQTLEVR